MNDLNRNQILEPALRVGTADTGPHWTAFEKRLGIMVFADSKEDAVDRLKKAVNFTMSNIISGDKANVRHVESYLKKCGVEYTTMDDAPSWVLQLTLDPEETLFATG